MAVMVMVVKEVCPKVVTITKNLETGMTIVAGSLTDMVVVPEVTVILKIDIHTVVATIMVEILVINWPKRVPEKVTTMEAEILQIKTILQKIETKIRVFVLSVLST